MHVNNQQNLNQNNNQLDHKPPPPVGNKPQRPQHPQSQSQIQPPVKEQTPPTEPKEKVCNSFFPFSVVFSNKSYIVS